jgi:hypothetical protein
MPRPTPIFLLTHAPRLDPTAPAQPPHVVVRVGYRQALVRAANDELRLEGSTFSDYAAAHGINLDADTDAANDGVWWAAQHKLADGGRLFLAFSDDEQGRETFVAAATEHGVRAQAEALVKRWQAE